MGPYVEIAVAFASALVGNDFAVAESFLTPELRQHLTQEALREKFFAMFRGYAAGEPQRVRFFSNA